MLQLLTFLILCYGITNIVVYGSIFNGPRNFIRRKANEEFGDENFWTYIKDLTSCPMCFSTWVGFFLSILLFSVSHEVFGVTQWVSWFFDGMIASGGVWAIHSIIEWFELNRPKQD